MSSWSEGRRPLTLAILALGGEGGGVLADWTVAAAERAGWHAQNTSVAGVAQRTGATVYYLELFPDAAANDGNGAVSVRPEPIMSIFPTPGEVDVVIASELMECGRAIQRGFATPERTTLITSTNRVYAIDEKMAPGDGRVDDRELLEAARRSSKRLIAADFAKLAEDNESVISASLFGALAGSGAVPLTREQFEAPIRASGKGGAASLAAFASGFEAVGAAQRNGDAPVALEVLTRDLSSRAAESDKAREEQRRAQLAATDPAALVGPALRELAQQTLELPPAARSMVLHGLVRTAVYQDLPYAERYLERLKRFAAVEPDSDGDARLTVEAARHIALWMCYQDTIQVALQKSRRARFERIRSEAKAKPNQLLEVRDFMHPRIDEFTDTMPTVLGATLRRSKTFQRAIDRLTGNGMILNTTSLRGYALLTTVARLRPLRPRSLRFGREQKAIERWIGKALAVAASDPELACELVQCQGVLKGYGATWAHGADSFHKLTAAADSIAGTPGAAARLAELRTAALADEDGAALDAKLAVLQAGPSDRVSASTIGRGR